jgi:hypothetical protein
MRQVGITITLTLGILLLVFMLVSRSVVITKTYVQAGYQQYVIVPPGGGPRIVWVKPQPTPFQLQLGAK